MRLIGPWSVWVFRIVRVHRKFVERYRLIVRMYGVGLSCPLKRYKNVRSFGLPLSCC